MSSISLERPIQLPLFVNNQPSNNSIIRMSVSPSLNSVHSNQSSDASASDSSSGQTSHGHRSATDVGTLVELGEDIITLTNYVKSFREALSKIKKIFTIDQASGQMMKPETRRIQAHERLGEVLRILRLILEKFPAIRSTELLMAAGNMINRVKGTKNPLIIILCDRHARILFNFN